MESEKIQSLIKQEPAVLVYFSAPDCSPCKAIRKRLRPLIENEFEKIIYVEMPENADPVLLAHFEAFSRPLLLVFFEGREFIRKGLNFSFEELRNEISRLYSLAFD